MRHIGFLFLLAFSAPLGASERVVVREISRNNFIATLSAGRELGIEEAQQQVLPAASHTCKDLIPVFGKYTFDSSKPASAKSAEQAERRRAGSSPPERSRDLQEVMIFGMRVRLVA